MHTHPAPGGCGAGQASQRQAQRDLAKPNFPPGSPGPPDTSTESIFRRAWKALVFWAGAERQSQRQPGAVPGRGVHRAPPSAPGASAGGSLKPTSGGPLPAGLRRLPGPAGKCAAPGTGAGPRYTARVAASASVPASAPRPALPAGPGFRVPSCPREQAPPQARGPARRSGSGAPPASQGRSAMGGRGGTPARTGAPRPLPCYCSRRLQEAAGWSRVRELSGLASPPAS